MYILAAYQITAGYSLIGVLKALVFTCKTIGDSTNLINCRRYQVTGCVHPCVSVVGEEWKQQDYFSSELSAGGDEDARDI
jgi:hypothetical protein